MSGGLEREMSRYWQGEQLASLLDQVRSAVIAVDIDRRITYWNRSAERLLGWEAAEVLASDILDVMAPPSARRMAAGILESVAREGHLDGEFAMQRRDGSTLPAHVAGAALKDPRGATVGLVGVFTDISDRVRVERALRESEARFRRLAENAPDLIYRCELSPVRGFTYVSPAAEEMTGYSPEEHYADPDLGFKIVHPEDRHLLAGLQIGRCFGEPLTLRWVRKDGRIVWTEQRNVPVRDADGNLVAIEGVARDVTDRREAEEALRRSEKLHRTLVEAVDDSINIKDAEGRYLLVNSAFAARVGMKKEEIVGKMVTEVHPPRFARQIVLDDLRVLASGEPVDGEEELTAADGSRIYHVRKVPVRDNTGRVLALVTMSRDVTERRRMEERLRRSERMEVAGQLAARVAHDFNNLLGPLVAYPELMKAQLPAGHPALRYCDAMVEAAMQMADINSDMLTLGRRGLLVEQRVDLNRLVAQAVEQLSGCPGTLRVEVHPDPELLPVRGAPAQLLRAIANLIANAREAMRDAGVLTLKTENIYLNTPVGSYSRVEAGEYVRLTVRDTGCGIPGEIRDRIFDAFFTTKRTDGRRGSGLGLSVVQAIVEDHQGYLNLETRVGEGTTFTLYLPVDRRPAEEDSTPYPAGGTETVLVVDDDSLQREVVGRLLDRLGYRVEVAGSGEEAVARVERQAIDLAILDMLMPPGIDGTETLRRMLEVRPGQRAIVMSGFAETNRAKEALALGAAAYVRKPLTLEKLARVLRGALDAGESTAQVAAAIRPRPAHTDRIFSDSATSIREDRER